jgi:hypothetical protein
MRKFLTVVAVFLLALILLAPFCIGQLCSGELKELAKSLESNSLQIKLTQYKTGWFTSTANLAVSKKFYKAARDGLAKGLLPKQLNFSAKLTVYHGPIVYFNSPLTRHHFYLGRMVVVGQLRLLNKQQAAHSLVVKSGVLSVPIPFIAVLGPEGFQKLIIELPEQSWVSKKTDKVAFKAVLGSIRMIVKPKEIHVHLGQFSYVQKGKDSERFLVSTGGSIRERFPHKNRHGLVTSFEWELPAVTLKENGKVAFSLRQLSAQTQNNVAKKMLSVKKFLTIKSAQGFGAKLSNIQAQLLLSNLNLKPALKLWHHAQTFAHLTLSQAKHQLIKLISEMLAGSSVKLETAQLSGDNFTFEAKGVLNFQQQSAENYLPKATGNFSYKLLGKGKASGWRYKLSAGFSIVPKQAYNGITLTWGGPSSALYVQNKVMALTSTEDLLATFKVGKGKTFSKH